MAASAAGKFVSALCTLRGTTGRLNLGFTQTCTLLQARNYAARKGTRERARKKKVKVEVKKVGFIAHNVRELKKSMTSVDKIRFDDSWKNDLPTDNVWVGRFYKTKVYTFEEAIRYSKETHSSEILDAPNAFVKAIIELDMKGPKPSRPVTKFARLTAAPHKFDHGHQRNIAAFCKSSEMQEEAKNAGATFVGGRDLVASIQTGEVAVSDIDYVIAHPDMMAELIVIKGLLKKKFPNPGAGSLGPSILTMLNNFLYGIKYSGHPHERQPLYGIAEAQFGRLDMEAKQLEENFAAVINDIMAHRPKREGPFITRIQLSCLPSEEVFKINHELYIESDKVGDKDDEDDDDDNEVVVDKKSAAVTTS